MTFDHSTAIPTLDSPNTCRQVFESAEGQATILKGLGAAAQMGVETSPADMGPANVADEDTTADQAPTRQQ